MSRAFDATALTNLRRVGEIALSPDGSWLAVQVARLVEDKGTYVSDLWKVAVDGSEPVRLTRGASNDTRPRFRRDGALGFLSNRNPREGDAEPGDDARSQVWLLPAGGGEPAPLTDEPLGVSDFKFARAADRLVVVAPVLREVAHDQQREHVKQRGKTRPTGLVYDRMPVRFWDHWLSVEAPHLVAYDERGGGRRDLTPDADREHRPGWFDVDFDVSADGARVATTRAKLGADRIEDKSVLVLDAATGATVSEVGDEPSVQHGHPVFSPDGRKLACTRHQRSAERAGAEELWVYDLATRAGRALARDWDTWVTPHAWTRDGAAVLATGPWRGGEPVVRVEAGSGETTRITAGGGCHGSIVATPAGDAIVGVRHTMLHPPEPFTAALSPGAEPRLLASLSGFTADDGAAIARWESIEVASTDGVNVQSFVVVPAGVSAAAPAPALINIHGGPMSHHIDGWHWRWNPLVWASAGYVVACPNPRGSVGFGQAFVEGIWRNQWGAQCFRDVMAVTDAVAARPEVDDRRVAAMGGSFGGYMSNWIGTQTDRFRCLITHASLYDLGAFHGATDVPPWLALETGANPWTQRDELERYSPHRQVSKWKTPTLIIHGERDYRVPIGEALALFEALQAHGVASELLVFPDENHWVLKPMNSRQWYETGLGFLARYLK